MCIPSKILTVCVPTHSYWDHSFQVKMKDNVGVHFPPKPGMQYKSQKTKESSTAHVSCGDTSCCFDFATYKYVRGGIPQRVEEPGGGGENWAMTNPFTLCCTSPNNETTI